MTNRLHFVRLAALLAALPIGGCGADNSLATPACGTYADAPKNASSVVYVSATCGARDGDGSEERPFASIQQGIDASAQGGAVLVDAGTYAENLSITKTVEVLGANTRGEPENASIIVQAPSPYAITVEGSTVVLRGIIVQKPQGAGIWVQKNGNAVLQDSRIEGTVAVNEDGHGVMATDSGSIIVERSIIVQSEGAGVYANAAAAAKVERSIIVQNGGFAGIWVQSTLGEVSLVGNEITENAEGGITILGTRAIIVQNQVKNTKSRMSGELADGIRVIGDSLVGEAYVEIGGEKPESKNVIEGNDRVGILFSGEKARGIIVQNEVVANADDTKRGAGIWVQSSAGTAPNEDQSVGIRIAQNRVEGNHYVGIGVTNNARAIIVQNPSISGTIAGEIMANGIPTKIGDGLGVYAGASAHVDKNTISSNARVGALFFGAANMCVMTNNTFEKNNEGSIIVQNTDGLALDTNETDVPPVAPAFPVGVDTSDL
ncbi:right-handed parallel beta-helix repeat-containing protein [Polyangium jinanense]|uniref:Right-handed parallel beta-helix repeat-containing protein n=1 Tax=Polyangium jinanense TaxID=2829994 RepID=A0A9X4AXT7_9BACT|nr:right-handed parallel beta-helix repeat-containing protein [Polyangium jinanense]MDC3957406.1 right-handed parallel beta-helix repeat-containing protein [Polyangium jinanense]MDC3988206.1 right-handed parallel beta-helix repeat-containing protein [Polyangium jinanense]